MVHPAKTLRHDMDENRRDSGAQSSGDPSILKSPVIAACTKPIERLDAQARDRHQEEMREYKIKLAAWKLAADKDSTRSHASRSWHAIWSKAPPSRRSPRSCAMTTKHTNTLPPTKCCHDTMKWLSSSPTSTDTGQADGAAAIVAPICGSTTAAAYVIDRIGRGSFAIPNWSAHASSAASSLGQSSASPKTANDDGLLQRFMYCVPRKLSARAGPQAGSARRPPLRRAVPRCWQHAPHQISRRHDSPPP